MLRAADDRVVVRKQWYNQAIILLFIHSVYIYLFFSFPDDVSMFLRALCCCLVCIFSHEWNIVSKRYGGIITAVLLEMVILLYCYVVSSSLREIVFFFHEKFRGKHSLFYGQFFFPRNSNSNLTPCNFFRGAFDCFMCTY